VDDYFGKALSYFVKKKSQMGTIVDNLLMIFKAASYNVQYLRCNNAGENVKGLTNICEKHNIKIEFTAPYTPQQNGIKFVTIRQRACAAMFAASFSDEFQGLLWAKATSTLTGLSNSVASTKDVKNADKLFYGHVPTIYKHLIQFGCVGWVMNNSQKVTKLDAKGIKC
jgi:hypothetical protein